MNLKRRIRVNYYTVISLTVILRLFEFSGESRVRVCPCPRAKNQGPAAREFAIEYRNKTIFVQYSPTFIRSDYSTVHDVKQNGRQHIDHDIKGNKSQDQYQVYQNAASRPSRIVVHYLKTRRCC